MALRRSTFWGLLLLGCVTIIGAIGLLISLLIIGPDSGKFRDRKPHFVEVTLAKSAWDNSKRSALMNRELLEEHGDELRVELPGEIYEKPLSWNAKELSNPQPPASLLGIVHERFFAWLSQDADAYTSFYCGDRAKIRERFSVFPPGKGIWAPTEFITSQEIYGIISLGKDRKAVLTGYNNSGPGQTTLDVIDPRGRRLIPTGQPVLSFTLGNLVEVYRLADGRWCLEENALNTFPEMPFLLESWMHGKVRQVVPEPE